MNKKQLEKMGFNFYHKSGIVQVTQTYIFATGDESWDSDESEYGDYMTMDEAVSCVASDLIFANALEKTQRFLDMAVEKIRGVKILNEYVPVIRIFATELRELRNV